MRPGGISTPRMIHKPTGLAHQTNGVLGRPLPLESPQVRPTGLIEKCSRVKCKTRYFKREAAAHHFLILWVAGLAGLLSGWLAASRSHPKCSPTGLIETCSLVNCKMRCDKMESGHPSFSEFMGLWCLAGLAGLLLLLLKTATTTVD